MSPLITQSIEVVRGPATILFGSGAIGGVVNVVDNRIPVELPPNPFSGEFDARFASGSLERSVAGQVEIALTKHFVLHLDGTFLRTDSRRVPDFALSERIRHELTPEQR
ncbi:MAG: TonB-dependent receptor plug domain-containing protein, partial [Chthoniobacterales bacterium]